MVPGATLRSTPEGTTFNLQPSTFNLDLSRSGDWTLLSVSALRTPPSARALLAEFKSRLQRDGRPFSTRATNYWFDADADVPGVSQALSLGWELPASFPNLSLQMIGDGQNVRTLGEVRFPQPLPRQLETWRLPLDLPAEPLIGLTVMRSVKPLLERLGVLSPEQSAHFPEQFLVWLRSGPPLQIYFALPSNAGTNEFRRLAPPIMDWVNSHTDARIYGAITMDTNRSELKWNGLSLCAPFFRAGDGYVQGGFGLALPNAPRLPRELHDHILNDSNLVYFDWELTSQTLPQWRYLDDVSRMVFDAAHASRLRSSRVSTDWLLANLTNLSHSVTEVHQRRPDQLVLTRKSTLGLNAVELNILINWTALPEFPGGMSTLWRTNPAPLRPLRSGKP